MNHLVDTFFSHVDLSLRFFSVHVLSSVKYLIVKLYKSFGNNIYIVNIYMLTEMNNCVIIKRITSFIGNYQNLFNGPAKFITIIIIQIYAGRLLIMFTTCSNVLFYIIYM